MHTHTYYNTYTALIDTQNCPLTHKHAYTYTPKYIHRPLEDAIPLHKMTEFAKIWYPALNTDMFHNVIASLLPG